MPLLRKSVCFTKILAYAYDVVLSPTRVVADHDVASATTRQLHQKLRNKRI